ncbi:Uncharacterised protein [Mycobacteroides abscessus subsp. abscessus]|nr:Uncharacterised protein [Mycobacteroides abscessus subsp. abscessus]SKW33167.1 Uncharacterised protein [Mycobacteroides abscessus subsp. abscessus]
MPTASRTAAIRAARLLAALACSSAACGSSSSKLPAVTRCLDTVSAVFLSRVRSSARTSGASCLASTSSGMCGPKFRGAGRSSVRRGRGD